ncbi:hypothetical protein SAMN04488168_12214 [Bacillus sp. 491mf]|nr:hypothetical protein SAMN04488168_12214 [Bacillus sp. 491mf]
MKEATENIMEVAISEEIPARTQEFVCVMMKQSENMI